MFSRLDMSICKRENRKVVSRRCTLVKSKICAYLVLSRIYSYPEIRSIILIRYLIFSRNGDTQYSCILMSSKLIDSVGISSHHVISVRNSYSLYRFAILIGDQSTQIIFLYKFSIIQIAVTVRIKVHITDVSTHDLLIFRTRTTLLIPDEILGLQVRHLRLDFIRKSRQFRISHSL